MFCKKCNVNIDEEASFCPYCGERLEPAEEEIKEENTLVSDNEETDTALKEEKDGGSADSPDELENEDTADNVTVLEVFNYATQKYEREETEDMFFFKGFGKPLKAVMLLFGLLFSFGVCAVVYAALNGTSLFEAFFG